jgi:hypothetical protein
MSNIEKKIVVAAFDDKKGPVAIFSTLKNEALINKIAVKSIVSTLSARDTNSKEKMPPGEAIIPFPDEDLLGFIYYVSLDQKTETGDFRVLSLTFLTSTSGGTDLYSNAPILSLEAKEISDLINEKYVYGQMFSSELQNEVLTWGSRKSSESKEEIIISTPERKKFDLYDLYSFFSPKKSLDPIAYVLLAFFQNIPIILTGPDPQHIIDFANLFQNLFQLKELKIELNLPSTTKNEPSKISRSDIVLLTDSQYRKSFFSITPILVITMDQEIKTLNFNFENKDVIRISDWLKKSREQKHLVLALQLIKTDLESANNRIKQFLHLLSLDKPIKEIFNILATDKDDLEFLGRILLRSGKLKAEQLNKLFKTNTYVDYKDRKEESLGFINL